MLEEISENNNSFLDLSQSINLEEPMREQSPIEEENEQANEIQTITETKDNTEKEKEINDKEKDKEKNKDKQKSQSSSKKKPISLSSSLYILSTSRQTEIKEFLKQSPALPLSELLQAFHNLPAKPLEIDEFPPLPSSSLSQDFTTSAEKDSKKSKLESPSNSQSPKESSSSHVRSSSPTHHRTRSPSKTFLSSSSSQRDNKSKLSSSELTKSSHSDRDRENDRSKEKSRPRIKDRSPSPRPSSSSSSYYRSRNASRSPERIRRTSPPPRSGNYSYSSKGNYGDYPPHHSSSSSFYDSRSMKSPPRSSRNILHPDYYLSNDLPPPYPWRIAFNNKKEPYFYNPNTSESSWELPSRYFDAPSSGNVSPHHSHNWRTSSASYDYSPRDGYDKSSLDRRKNYGYEPRDHMDMGGYPPHGGHLSSTFSSNTNLPSDRYSSYSNPPVGSKVSAPPPEFNYRDNYYDKNDSYGRKPIGIEENERHYNSGSTWDYRKDRELPLPPYSQQSSSHSLPSQSLYSSSSSAPPSSTGSSHLYEQEMRNYNISSSAQIPSQVPQSTLYSSNYGMVNNSNDFGRTNVGNNSSLPYSMNQDNISMGSGSHHLGNTSLSSSNYALSESSNYNPGDTRYNIIRKTGKEYMDVNKGLNTYDYMRSKKEEESIQSYPQSMKYTANDHMNATRYSMEKPVLNSYYDPNNYNTSGTSTYNFQSKKMEDATLLDKDKYAYGDSRRTQLMDKPTPTNYSHISSTYTLDREKRKMMEEPQRDTMDNKRTRTMETSSLAIKKPLDPPSQLDTRISKYDMTMNISGYSSKPIIQQDRINYNSNYSNTGTLPFLESLPTGENEKMK